MTKTRTENALEIHKRYCNNFDYVNTVYPTDKDKFVYFKNHHKMHKTPITIYADFESYLEEVDISKGEGTKAYQKHKPSGYCLYVTRFDGKNYGTTYVDTDAVNVGNRFTQDVEKITREFYDEFKHKSIPIKNLGVANKALRDSTNCYVCGEWLGSDRVRDHDHFSGMFRGITHNKCNVKMQEPKFIPIVMHNLARYDEKLFLRELGWVKGEVDCIAKNAENFISFSKKIVVDVVEDAKGNPKEIRRGMRFIDSFKFMASSLEKLAANLSDYPELSDNFPDHEKFKLVKRKGVFPYDWWDSPEKLDYDRLPAKEDFYNKLTDSNISDSDYEHAKNVWKKFNMKTMADYHNLYLETDVLLLADVFETFRNKCLSVYKLDPAQYLTAPGLAWDAALKMTGVKLELFTEENSEMLLMIEKGIRGGISMAIHRHSIANNKYMRNFNPNLPIKFIFYLDENNLYGYAMCQPLPTGGFRWLSKDEIENWDKLPEGKGCTLEVDLEYPKELHDRDNDFPMAPEHLGKGQNRKLIPNLRDKKNYVVHHKALKCYFHSVS